MKLTKFRFNIIIRYFKMDGYLRKMMVLLSSSNIDNTIEYDQCNVIEPLSLEMDLVLDAL